MVLNVSCGSFLKSSLVLHPCSFATLLVISLVTLSTYVFLDFPRPSLFSFFPVLSSLISDTSFASSIFITFFSVIFSTRGSINPESLSYHSKRSGALLKYFCLSSFDENMRFISSSDLYWISPSS